MLNLVPGNETQMFLILEQVDTGCRPVTQLYELRTKWYNKKACMTQHDTEIYGTAWFWQGMARHTKPQYGMARGHTDSVAVAILARPSPAQAQARPSLQIWKFGNQTNPKNETSQNQNPCRPKCWQGLH